MNPNPYRTALLVIGVAFLCVGVILFIVGATDSDYATAFNLGMVAGILLSIAGTILMLWLVASAIIYALTITPTLPQRPTFADWLGMPSQPRQPPTPSHLDEDGL